MVTLDKVTRRNFLKAAGSGTVAVTLAGCTGSDDDQPEGEGQDGGDTTSTTNNEGSSDGQSNELVGLLAKTLVTRDPHKILDADTIVLGVNVYDGFLKTDNEGRVAAQVATDWTVENNGKTWIFTIQEGLQTHAGNEITADDVVYSAKRYMAVGTGFSSLWEGFLTQDNVEARGDYEVAFTLSEPYGPFLATLPLFLLVDSTELKKHEEEGDYGERGDYGENYLTKNFVGTGPYEVTSFTQGEEYIFEKFDDYWQGWEDNQFDTVRWKIILEESTQRQMMKQGDADFSDIFLSPEAYSDMDSASNVNVHKEPGVQVYEFPLNTTKPPFDDVNVRKAFSLALDYETAQSLLDATPAQGMVPTVLVGHNPDIPKGQQDLEAAKQALEESKYSLEEINGMDIQLAWISSATVERRLGLLLQEGLGELGIESVSLKSMTWSNWTQMAADPDSTPHINSLYHTGNYPSPEGFLYGKYHPSSQGSYNACNFYHDDEELVSVLEEARAEPDTDTRLSLWQDAQQIASEAYPGIFAANPPYYIAVNSNLGWEYGGGIQGFQRMFYEMTRTGDGRA